MDIKNECNEYLIEELQKWTRWDHYDPYDNPYPTKYKGWQLYDEILERMESAPNNS